jgi:anti-anti-sigma factor
MTADFAPRLRVRTEERADAILLFPEGDVDTESHDLFRQALSAAMAANRAQVVVDLAEVRYIDTVGLGALVTGLRAAGLAGCRLSLVSPNPHIQRVLHLTGVSRLMPVYQLHEEALEENAESL